MLGFFFPYKITVWQVMLRFFYSIKSQRGKPCCVFSTRKNHSVASHAAFFLTLKNHIVASHAAFFSLLKITSWQAMLFFLRPKITARQAMLRFF